MAFLAFSLKPLAAHPASSWTPGSPVHARQDRTPDHRRVRALVEQHRAAGDTLMIITATNAFVTAPIAQRLGIANLIATDPEKADGRYTGRVAGTPSFREGKVSRLRDWLSQARRDPGWRLVLQRFAQRPAAARAGQPPCRG